MKMKFTPIAAAAAVLAASTAQAQIFSDSFDSDTEANYSIVTGDSDTAGGNPIVNLFGYNYTNTSNITNVLGAAIPEAPNSPGSDGLGLLTQCNAVDGGYEGGFSGDVGNFGTQAIYPDLGSAISGDHQITVDAYYRVTTASGSTEQIMLGVLVPDKTTLNNLFQDGSGSGATVNTGGYFFQIAGEYGFGSFDVSFYEGATGAADPQLNTNDVDSSGFNWGDNRTGSDSIQGGDGDAFFDGFWPSPFGDQSGLPGPTDAWATYRMKVEGGVVSVEIDNGLGGGFATLLTYDDPDDTYTSGFPHIGHEDSFNSSNSDGAIIWDNLVVEAIGGTSVNDWSVFH